jgi:uncharacterized Zn finger protein
MALSSIIKQTCKECGKIAVEKSRISFGKSKLITLECGHVTAMEVMSSNGANYDSIVSADGRNYFHIKLMALSF